MRPEARRLAMVLFAALLAGCGTSGGTRSDRPATAAQKKAASAAEINVSLGQAYLSQGRLELALDKIQKALELDPRLPSAHTVIAVIYERINDPAKAQYHYKRATELAPKSGDVNNNYGTFLCRNGKYAEADRHFERALADPFYGTPAIAHANRGACAAEWGKPEIAEKHLEQALNLQKDLPEALYQMAGLLHRRGEHFRARAYVQRYESVAPASVESLRLALAIEQSLKNDRAVREYRRRLATEFPDAPSDDPSS